MTAPPFSVWLLRAAAALNLKGVAVGALRNRGVLLVGDDLDAVERAEVLVGAVVLALVDGAFDAHVCVGVVFHDFYLPSIKIDEVFLPRLLFCTVFGGLCIRNNHLVKPIPDDSGNNPAHRFHLRIVNAVQGRRFHIDTD